MPSNLQYPEEEFKDNWPELVKAFIEIVSSLTGVPTAGTLLSKVFGTLVNPKLQQRREQFFKDLAIEVMKLSRQFQSLRIENLRDNDIFISVLIEATNIAIKTHQEEKRKVLQNAVLNSVVLNDLDETWKSIFFQLIDSLTPRHSTILKFYSSIDGTDYEGQAIPYHDLFIKRFPEIKIDRPLFYTLRVDLIQKGLLQMVSLNNKINPNDHLFKLYDMALEYVELTELGKGLLKFISEPEVEE